MRPTSQTLITAATVMPVGVAEFKAQARITESAEDSLIQAYLAAATSAVESKTGRALCSQTWDFKYDRFGDELLLGLQPVSSITSITYYDSSVTQQTVSASVYELGQWNGVYRVRPKYMQTWPVAIDQPESIAVRAVCGYGTAPQMVPQELRLAIMLLAAEYYRKREATSEVEMKDLPYAVKFLLSSYYVFGVV
jgi:uncharacterized phiE125 gp8 family phage protein